MLFEVTFNWYGEVHTEYTQANKENVALNNVIAYIAKKSGYNRGFVRAHLRQGNKVTIKQVKRKEDS